MSRDPRLYLTDIVECCAKITGYRGNMSREEFIADERTFDAVVRNLEIIGEASKHVTLEVRILMSDVDWRAIAGMRDVMIHAYFGVDRDLVCDIVWTRIADLRTTIKTYLDSTTL